MDGLTVIAASNNMVGKLIWSDEFDASAASPPDPLWWSHEIGGHGWGNGELQFYTKEPANASHDGRGNLVIRALRSGHAVTSARLITKGRFEFQHGRLEARALLPAGAGLWSAIWMLGSDIDAVGWPACGEIDVMENLGAEPHRVFGTVHCPAMLAVSEGTVVERDGEIVGFALCRRFGRGHVVGPVVAASEADAAALVAPHVAAHAGRFLRLDSREAEGPLRSYLEACGLYLFDTGTLMSLGRERVPEGPPRIYGLASHPLG